MVNIKTFLCIFLVASILISCQNTRIEQKKLELAKWHYDHKKYTKAEAQLQPLSHQGDPEAQYLLGYMYYYGQGVKQDREKARELFIDSARKSHPLAILAWKRMRQEDGKKKTIILPTGPVQKNQPRIEKELDSNHLKRSTDNLIEKMHNKIANIASNYYAIQIIGLSNLDRMKELIAKLKHKDLIYYQTIREGKPWFVLIKGQYKYLAEARKAERLINAEIGKWSPFVVKYGAIKARIKGVI